MSQQNSALPVALYRADQTRELDRRLIAAGTSGFELMQRAAQALWRHLRQYWPQAREITVMAGGGNNAGDGYLLACLAHQAGWTVQVWTLSDPERLTGEAARAWQEALEVGVPTQPWSSACSPKGIVVDALLGTGVQGKLRSPYTQAIEAINTCGCPVLAVDLPSGLHADKGVGDGVVVRADLTVTFIALKLGLLTGVAPDLTGSLAFASLGADDAILASLPPMAQRLTAATLPRLAPRPRVIHKGDLGHVLVLGGELGTGGAALLAAEAALGCGAGLVSLATRPEHVLAALVRRPEVMVRGVSSTFDLQGLAERATVLVVGPGLGQGPWGQALLSVAQIQSVPQVWDADALNLLAETSDRLPANSVMTPHPGEAARLLGCSIAAVQKDRPAAALDLAQQRGGVVLLKGTGSLVATPNGDLFLCDRGHPAMAGAGLGDVLSGVIGALLAQGLAAAEATCLAVWLHAVAGERLAEQGRGLAAADLSPVIRQLLEAQSPCLS